MKFLRNTIAATLMAMMLFNFANAQNYSGKSDDHARIAIAPVIPEAWMKMPQGAQEMLLGKMRQMIGLNGLSALDDAPLFVMNPELMIISSDVTPTTPAMYTYNMELVLNVADRYSGNVYATATQALKGAGNTETAAYNSAFKQIDPRSGKYKVMLEKGKEAIIEYYNTQCDLVISRANSLAAQKKYANALALLNSVPPVCRECFDNANEAAAIIGANTPETTVAVTSENNTPDGDGPVYSSLDAVDLGDNLYLRYKHGKNVGVKTMLYFELINKNEEDVDLKIYRIYQTMLINEKGDEVKIDQMMIASKKGSNWIEATLIPDVNTELICEFPKVKEVKFIKFFIKENIFKFKNLPITN
ncbi:MAG: hypothetical protein PHX39_14570 [Bacteroidales bacterium]|nr:hypothetical protein [Bacteroidales bacterium]